MISKDDLGVGYLVGTGFALNGVLVLRLLLFPEAVDFVSATGTLTGAVLSTSLVYAGYWLYGSDFEADRVWTVAQWGAAGLAALTVSSFPAIVRLLAGVPPEGNVVINNIAAGGVAGVLFGLATELREERDRTHELNRRNLVLNRVLRHNIRNDMNVILGYVDTLERELDGTDEEMVRLIGRRANEVTELGETARHIETIADRDGTHPIEAADLVGRRVEALGRTYPYADIEVDSPVEAWVQADSLLASVVDAVVENAVEHNRNPQPEIEVSISRDDEWTVVRVADNGPGMPEEVVNALRYDDGTSADRYEGLGLRMAGWIVDSYGGELSFEPNDPHGTVVTIRLRRADLENQLTETLSPSRSSS